MIADMPMAPPSPFLPDDLDYADLTQSSTTANNSLGLPEDLSRSTSLEIWSHDVDERSELIRTVSSDRRGWPVSSPDALARLGSAQVAFDVVQAADAAQGVQSDLADQINLFGKEFDSLWEHSSEQTLLTLEVGDKDAFPPHSTAPAPLALQLGVAENQQAASSLATSSKPSRRSSRNVRPTFASQDDAPRTTTTTTIQSSKPRGGQHERLRRPGKGKGRGKGAKAKAVRATERASARPPIPASKPGASPTPTPLPAYWDPSSPSYLLRALPLVVPRPSKMSLTLAAERRAKTKARLQEKRDKIKREGRTVTHYPERAAAARERSRGSGRFSTEKPPAKLKPAASMPRC